MEDNRSILDKLIRPVPRYGNLDPNDDLSSWKPADRVNAACRAFLGHGFGLPGLLPVFYVVKLAFFAWVWALLCGQSLWRVAEWYAQGDYFVRLLLWSVSFEIGGLGCCSGPMSGKFVPPFTSAQHFLRVGSARLSLFDDSWRSGGSPFNRIFYTWLGGTQRSWFDVAVYLLIHASVYRALMLTAVIDWTHVAPVVALLLLGGLRDKTLFLCARSEHYWVMLTSFVIAGNSAAGIAALKVTALALWFFAGLSKAHPGFPYVIMVMTATHPLAPAWLRRLFIRSLDKDQRPTRLCEIVAHAATTFEMSMPLLYALGVHSRLQATLMTLFHIHILASIPAGVPLEWNVVMITQTWYLFSHHGAVPLSALLDYWPVAAFALFLSVIIPLYGQIFPDRVSFLFAMRYYAGNWNLGIMFFAPGYDDFVARAKRASAEGRFFSVTTPDIKAELAKMGSYPSFVSCVSLMGVVFASLHLPFRAILVEAKKTLPPKALEHIVMSEVLPQFLLGWNFADGHLANPTAQRVFATTLGYKKGEVFMISVEGAPLFAFANTMQVRDMVDGTVLSERVVPMSENLERKMPWSE